MVRKIILLISFLLLFVGTNVLTTLGFDPKSFYALIIGVSIFLTLVRKEVFIRDKQLVTLVLVVSLYSIFKLYSDRGEGTRFLVLQIIGAPIIFSAYPMLSEKYGQRHLKLWKGICFLLILSFIVETSLATAERVLNYNLFEWKTGDTLVNFATESVTGFRSAALYGHPLYNALIVSTFMSFILIAPFKVLYKYILWGMGYMAILSFNTRSSMVGNALLLLVYIFYSLFLDKKISSSIRSRLFFGAVLIAISGLYLFFNLGFGGRLLEMGLFDDSSAQTRVNTWEIFNNVNWDNLVWGISYNDMQNLLYRSGMRVTENFWIDQLFGLGIVFYSIYLSLYILLIRKLYRGYSKFAMLFTSVTFVLIASTNNSLSSNFLALIIYLLLIVTFNPQYVNQLISRKYLVNIKRKNIR